MADDPLALLHLPPGLPGSGRLRYGAAMALWRDGLIGDEALEVFRIASARDRQDPRPLLAERGLAMPAPPPARAEPLVRSLVDEILRCLAGLPGPGPVEARCAIAGPSSGPFRLPAPQDHPVRAAHLDAAVAAAARSRPVLAGAIAAVAPLLRWQGYGGYAPGTIGSAFLRNHCFAPLVGGDGPVIGHGVELGLFLIAPQVLYRDHAHPAPELYLPLTGPHGWRFTPDAPLVRKDALQPVWNPPGRPHLIKAGAVPFLSVYVWTGDVDLPAVVVPAGDWPALEALRL